MWGGLTPEQLVGSIQPNGDSIYTYSVGYICRNLPATIKLLLRSVSAQGGRLAAGAARHRAGRADCLSRRCLLAAWLRAAACAARFGADRRSMPRPCPRAPGWAARRFVPVRCRADLPRGAQLGRRSTTRPSSACRGGTGCRCCRWRWRCSVPGAALRCGGRWPGRLCLRWSPSHLWSSCRARDSTRPADDINFASSHRKELSHDCPKRYHHH